MSDTTTRRDEALRAELSALRSAVAVPDKVSMPAGWTPMAHRARHAAALGRIDEIRESLGLHVWQCPWSTAPAFNGMPQARHRALVKAAALAGRWVPPDASRSHPGLADELAAEVAP